MIGSFWAYGEACAKWITKMDTDMMDSYETLVIDFAGVFFVNKMSSLQTGMKMSWKMLRIRFIRGICLRGIDKKIGRDEALYK